MRLAGAIKSSDKDKPTRTFSKKQENQVAKTFGGSRVKNSGATMFAKGDVTTDNILFECKTKTSPSETMTIHKEWITKNAEEALFMGKPYSVVCFNFGPGSENYYILSESDFQEFVEYINNKE
jgi:hypothetical protein